VKSKERPTPNDEPEPVERDDVRLAANRCPFCHDDVEKAASVACQGCLARHHASCWTESRACSACGCEVSLQAATATGDARRPGWVVTLCQVLFVAAVGGGLSLINSDPGAALILVLLGAALVAWAMANPGSTRAWLTYRTAREDE
jgi:hypothetical protein